MKKLFLILLFIVIASYDAHAADRTVRCMSLFSKGNASMHINNMKASFDVKKRLLLQTIRSQSIREFVVEFSLLIDQLYETRFVEALESKNDADYKSLGFNSIDEARALKEVVISKEIRVLSIMDPNDMTSEFAADFKRIAIRIYDTKTSRKEVLLLNDRLDQVILSYSDL
ncbi:MAG: hypothetical protein V4596_00905 [Bdellovibrionota bacterium]